MKKVIDKFDFEEVYLLVSFMRSNVKEKIIQELEEMSTDDVEMKLLIEKTKKKIEPLTQEELNELLSDLPSNEFSN